jgi:hypothetical protein
MIEIITEQGNFTNLDAENQYYAKMIVFKSLDIDSSLYTSGLPSDSLLESFYDSIKVANGGKLVDVQNLFSQKDYNSAEIINNSIIPENNSETNQKIVNEVYASTWAREIYEYTNSQYNLLFEIANQSPITGGLAVYASRAMLDIDIYDSIPENASRVMGNFATSIKDNLTSEVSELELFPNPASSLITLKYRNGKLLNGTISIRNLLGSSVILEKIANSSSGEILITSLPKGVYILTYTDALRNASHLRFVKN